MTVFRRPDSPVWYYEFEHKGVRYRSSTGQMDENDARAVEAKARLRVRREAAGIEDPEPSASVTFSVWAEHYYLHAKDRLKMKHPDRIDNLSRVALRFWGARPATELEQPADPARPYHDLRLIDVVDDPTWLRRWDDWLEMAKREAPRRRRDTLAPIGTKPRLIKWSAQTKNQLRSWLSQMFHLATHPTYREATGIIQNPTAGMWRDRAVGREVTITVDDLNAILAVSAEHLRLAISIAILAPKLRLANILGLRWKDLIDDGRYLRIARHKTEHATGRPMVAYVSDQLREILQAIRKRRPGGEWVVSYRGDRVKEVRGSVAGAVERAAVTRPALTYGRKTDGITFHTLRHTAATLLAELDVPPSKRQQLMGHLHFATTMKYEHLKPSSEASAAETLSAAVPIKDLVLQRWNQHRPFGATRAGGSGGTRPPKIAKSPANTPTESDGVAPSKSRSSR